MSKPKSPCFNLIVCCENEFLLEYYRINRLIQIKTNIRYTLTSFRYQFIYLISLLSHAVNFLHSLLVLQIMICHKL